MVTLLSTSMHRVSTNRDWPRLCSFEAPTSGRKVANVYTLEELNIIGFRGGQVPNTLVRQGERAAQLAILYPGFGYSCDMPLFYYIGNRLLAGGSDVLRVEYAYNRQPEFRELPVPEQHDWQRADASGALDAVLQQDDYRQITIVGKSIGTRSMGHVLNSDPRLGDATALWLTPLFKDDNVRRQILQTSARSLIVIGMNDPHYDAETLEEIALKDGNVVISIPNADHSLDIAGDVKASIGTLKQVISGVDSFLYRQGR